MNILSEIAYDVWMMPMHHANPKLPLIINAWKNPVMARNEDAKSYEDKGATTSLRFAAAKSDAYWISEFGNAVSPEDAPSGSIAIISIVDAISKYDQPCGPAGMLMKSDLLKRCYANEKISAIIINADTPGGSSNAGKLMADTIVMRNKPVICFADDLLASAGYMIGSNCDAIIANNATAEIGSIGTYCTLFDFREYLEKEGIKIIEIYADASKDKNQEYYQAIDGNTDLLKEKVNRINDEFISSVVTGRGKNLLADKKEWGSGKLFFADQALKMGLIDGIGTLEDVVRSLSS